MITHSLKILKDLQYPSGLFAAASKNVGTGYDKSWIRDNIYAVLGFEATGDTDTAVKTFQALLDIMKQHEDKIEWMIKQPFPKERYRYIHARFDPNTGNEINEDWGNKQNDAVGALLFKIGDLQNKGVEVIRDESDIQIIQKLVSYLAAIEYWQDEDNGMWEENEEVHASSVGACVAGLRAVANIVNVPDELIQKGQDTLNNLLPRESATKEVDLALLSLIYPYNVVSDEQRDAILKNIHEHLEEKNGVLRYLNDQYYHNGKGSPAWTMGFPWLAIIYKQLGDNAKYKQYLQKTVEVMNDKGEMPELYLAAENTHNENTPLGWAQSLYVVAAA